MREILFRAKAINREKGYHRTKYKNGDWVYGLITKTHNDIFPTLPMEMRNTDGINNLEVDYKTIGQYTGLTDKNGKKIFEGDIVRFNNQIGKIINEYGSFGIGIDECINYKRLEVYIEDKTNNYYSGVYNDNFISLWEICWNCNTIDKKIKEVEVIGNIHENPELLGEYK